MKNKVKCKGKVKVFCGDYAFSHLKKKNVPNDCEKFKKLHG